MANKVADLAGPGVSTYEEVAKGLPTDYRSVLTPKETQKALYAVKRCVEDGLNRELNLMLVQCPLIMDKHSGMNDFLELPYHKMILNDEIPLSIGGGIGQSRLYGYILKKIALGEVSVTIWPEQLHEICAARNIHLLR